MEDNSSIFGCNCLFGIHRHFIAITFYRTVDESCLRVSNVTLAPPAFLQRFWPNNQVEESSESGEESASLLHSDPGESFKNFPDCFSERFGRFFRTALSTYYFLTF